MADLKVCFVGIGSIAKRHIRNITDVCNEKGINLNIDAYRHYNLSEVPGEVDRVVVKREELNDSYDAIFITNPTDLHLKTLSDLHNKSDYFFIEKPLVSLGQMELAKNFALRENAFYYVACPLRYSSVIQYIKNNIDKNCIKSVRCISSSYLPDWRPGVDYRLSYSAHREMGGGVDIDLIHEWDYITYLFGWPEEISYIFGKKSDLEIDSKDLAIYIADYSSLSVEIHLDYFGRYPIRKIELFTSDDTIVGDLIQNNIRFLKENKVIEFKEGRDHYQKRELKHFLKQITDNTMDNHDYYNALRVLGLTQGEIWAEE